MAHEGWAGFNQVDTCEHFWVMTADPKTPSPIEGASTMGILDGLAVDVGAFLNLAPERIIVGRGKVMGCVYLIKK